MKDEINKILEYADGRKNQILDILKNNDVCDEIPYLSRESFSHSPSGFLCRLCSATKILNIHTRNIQSILR